MSDADAEPCRVRFLPANVVVEVPCGRSLLEAALDHGVLVSFACTQGACRLDRVRVRAGLAALSAPTAAELLYQRAAGADPCRRLACQTRVLGDCVIDVADADALFEGLPAPPAEPPPGPAPSPNRSKP